LIVTTTPSREPLLGVGDIRLGTYVTAVGADGGGKQELDPRLFAIAEVCAVDSREQCADFGDSSFALKAGLVKIEHLVEIGQIIQDRCMGRHGETDITIADLTGVAVQDIQIAKLVLGALSVAA
jgi:ornithine cyclodeaminase